MVLWEVQGFYAFIQTNVQFSSCRSFLSYLPLFTKVPSFCLNHVLYWIRKMPRTSTNLNVSMSHNNFFDCRKGLAIIITLNTRKKHHPKIRLSLHTSQGAHQARAYPGFWGMKRLGMFYSPLDGMLVCRRIIPNIRFASSFIHLGGERHCESKVFCPRKQPNVPSQGLNLEHLIQSRAH